MSEFDDNKEDSNYIKIQDFKNIKIDDLKPLNFDFSKPISSKNFKGTFKEDTSITYTRDDMKAAREKEVNSLIEIMKEPLEQEQNSKIKYRKYVLIGYLTYFLAVTIFVFGILCVFGLKKGGITNNEVKISQYLVTGLFVNLISLAVVVFKYLFDDKNSLMKDVIQLMVETLKDK